MSEEKRIGIRPSLYILEEGRDTYKVIQTSRRRILTFKVDSLVKEIISGLESDREYRDFVNYLANRYNRNSVLSCIGAMESNGILRIYNGKQVDQRFQKQIEFLDEFTSSYDETLRLHKKVRDSKITVFGVGGIGSWMVNGLAQIGVGEISICDPDVVEISNLNRQLFFTERDNGRYKVDVIKERLSGSLIVPHKRFVSKEGNLEDLVVGRDFLVNCADSPSVQETSEVIDVYANKFSVPYLVSGGYNLHLGMIGPIIIPGKTRTFSDFLDYQKRHDSFSELKKVKDIGSAGNLGPIAGAIANIQVMEIFKYLTGKGKLNLNRFGEVDFMDLSISWRQFGPEINL